MPERSIKDEDQVIADFEFTPVEAPTWLGEEKQPTQIDVYFEVKRQAECIGHVLIEVKYSERSFGACRGWTKRVPKGKHDLDPIKFNQDRSRCLNIAAVINSPNTQCWLAEQEGRNYWELLKTPSSSIRLDVIQQTSGCPFRYGLYQMMRNRVLADELMRHTGAKWAEFIVCRHPKNDKVIELKDDVYLSLNAVTAFRSFSNPNSVLEWNPIDILRAIASTSDSLQDWELWMRDRYFN
jgi:hypothetical protein